MKGNIKWKRNFGQMDIVANFGEGSSPAISKDKIFIQWDHQGKSVMYALNKIYLMSGFRGNAIKAVDLAKASGDITRTPAIPDDAVICELGLYKGQKILYLFDYSDSWEFLVKLIAIDGNEDEFNDPQITEMKGEAPPQYRFEQDLTLSFPIFYRRHAHYFPKNP